MPLVTSRLILRSEGTGNFVAAINVIHKKKTSGWKKKTRLVTFVVADVLFFFHLSYKEQYS